MAKRSGDPLWSVSFLKSRNWTEALMRALLPKPSYITRFGRRIRVWKKSDVCAAESDPRFLAERGQAPATVEPAPPWETDADAAKTVAALAAAWDAAEKDASPACLLAERYHAGVLERIAASGRKRLRGAQAGAYLKEFLALEKNRDSASLPGVLRNFAKAGAWLGHNPNDPLTGLVHARYMHVLRAAADRAAADFSAVQPEAELGAFLKTDGFPSARLLTDGLGTVWSVWYVPRAIRSSLSLLVALNPKDEYPEARAMKRHFVLHLGGTNTGKTYAGLRRLMRSETGVYLGPLRLLALEAQETLLDAGVACSLTTGEEEDRREGDTHVAATAEKLDLKARYAAAVIDECQMIADRQRGYAWTRAILGVLAPEVHLCAAPEAKLLLLRLIESCGDSYEIVEHRRKTPLTCMTRTVDVEHVQPGDALITFSKVGVLSVAEDLRQMGKEPAIIYGALPYATRRRQMEGFLEGRMEYVVSTDAIGMGLNLPIRRVIFMETEKYDGVLHRELKPEEIQQIAGRAGRYGMYDRGFVGATRDLSAVRAGLEAVVPPLSFAVAGFSDLVLQVDFDLLEVLTEWAGMPTAEPYVKLDISRYIAVISKLREKGFLLTKEQELRAANIPFDETDELLRDLFFDFLRRWQAGEEIEQPALGEEGARTLPELEEHYRKLDLYFSFAKAFDCPVDEEKLYDSRERVAEEINEILLHRLRGNIRFCARCGKALPMHQKGRLCDACYRSARKPGERRRR